MLYIVDMNKKYIKYIDYIVSDIEKPYLINMRDNYGLKDNECVLVLSKVFNQPVTIKDNSVYDTNGKVIYQENSNGYWAKWEYDNQGKIIYYETSNGNWYKYEYDTNGNEIYFEDSDGYIEDNRYE